MSYHADTRGSTTLLTDEHGRVTDRYTYGLYGELEAHEGRTKQPFCYNGRDGVMTDPNGLYYMRARYYHPGLKRFLNRDVLQGDMTDGQTSNRFAYVNGDPIGFIDPLGLMKCPPKDVGEDELVTVYRGTRGYLEKQVYDETGYLLSDATRTAYLETGDLVKAYKASQSTHDEWLKIWDNNLDDYIQAHGAFGTELPKAFNLDRTLMFVTKDEKIAKYFADGGRVYEAKIPKS